MGASKKTLAPPRASVTWFSFLQKSKDVDNKGARMVVVGGER